MKPSTYNGQRGFAGERSNTRTIININIQCTHSFNYSLRWIHYSGTTDYVKKLLLNWLDTQKVARDKYLLRGVKILRF
jgi:hypothetical protein